MAKKDKKTPVKGKEVSNSQAGRKIKTNSGLYIGSVLILVLIIITFVFSDFISSGGSRGVEDWTFGYYDEVPISYKPGNLFGQYVSQLYRYYQETMDTNESQVDIRVWQQAFEFAAEHTAVLHEVKISNYLVPGKAVDRQIAMLPQFHVNGHFSSNLYNKQKKSERDNLWRQVQDDIAKEQYYNDINSLLISSGEENFIGSMSSKARKFDMVFFKTDDFPNIEYLAFALENPGLFSTIRLSKITITAGGKEAQMILTSVKEGVSTFEDAAKTQSQDDYASKGGDMGLCHVFELGAELPAESRDKVINLGAGEISDLILINGKWMFFRVDDELKAANFEDNTVMEKVRTYVRNEERGRMQDWAIKQADGFIAEAETSGFDSAVYGWGRERRSFGPLSVNYGSTELFTTLESFSVPELFGASTNLNFWKTAFSTELNTLSKPVVQGNNVLVFLPTEETEADESSIERVVSMYTGYWLNYMTRQSFKQFFLSSPKMVNNFWEAFFKFVARQ
jgi:hypothetical protein